MEHVCRYLDRIKNIKLEEFRVGDIVNHTTNPSSNSGIVSEVRENTLLVYWPNTPTVAGRGPWEHDKDKIKLVARLENK